ncbi:glutamate racemase [Pleionea litopenaei]|uniref:Glutamate racemase n=1 Tax=Pleionea litopenaei TaxID=3070815 RepID=A0AA51RR54_9GAMM|nr:glutamate racemase [Pleionea sp. HL-JVS1]WMS86112.1 glutamate racemase [Pleionea sp. HL-JVS1]
MSKVLVLDSGIGGLTVVKSMSQLLPRLSIDYVADNLFFPYGTKTQAELKQRLLFLIERQLQSSDYDAIVIACNSASTLVLDEIRKQINLPIVGVVPAIKPAAQLSKNKRIGLLATEATVNGQYVDQLIEQFANDCHVTKVASQQLVLLAEIKLQGLPLDFQSVAEIVKPFIEQKSDVVVLGCTHFPWFKSELTERYPDIAWIDSGEAIARRVSEIIPKTEASQDSELQFFATGNPYQRSFLSQFHSIEKLK